MINPYQTPALIHEPRRVMRRVVNDALYVMVWSVLGFAIPYLIRGGFQWASRFGIQNLTVDLTAYEWLPAAIACMLVLGMSATLRRFPRLNLRVFESILIVGGAMIGGLVASAYIAEIFGVSVRRLRSMPPLTGLDIVFNYQFGMWLIITVLLITVVLTVRPLTRK